MLGGHLDQFIQPRGKTGAAGEGQGKSDSTGPQGWSVFTFKLAPLAPLPSLHPYSSLWPGQTKTETRGIFISSACRLTGSYALTLVHARINRLELPRVSAAGRST
jgi:hypothetical protein